METDAGHRQRQQAEHALFQGVEGPGEIKGDSDREQADGEVHQVGMHRNRIGEVVRPEGINDVVDRGDDRGQKAHEITPSRMASTTGTVCRPYTQTNLSPRYTWVNTKAAKTPSITRKPLGKTAGSFWRTT